MSPCSRDDGDEQVLCSIRVSLLVVSEYPALLLIRPRLLLLSFTSLCVFWLKVDSHGVVTVSPDFNEHKPAYRIENRHRG